MGYEKRSRTDSACTKWSQAEDDELIAGRVQRLGYVQISARLKRKGFRRSPNACQCRSMKLGLKLGRAAPDSPATDSTPAAQVQPLTYGGPTPALIAMCRRRLMVAGVAGPADYARSADGSAA